MYQLFPNVDRGKLKEELELFTILPMAIDSNVDLYMHFIIFLT